MDRKRLMIIVWKWLELNRDNNWDYALVKDQPDDKIIRVLDKKSDKAKKQLYDFVKENKDADIFIFLHRGHHYNMNDVREIVHHIKSEGLNGNLIKAFLFSESRDFLYYMTHNEGLLDEIGYFMNEREFEREEINSEGKVEVKYENVAVAKLNPDSGQYEVIPKHFNRVWRHYKHEFKKKIDSLHIDLISKLLEIEEPNSNKREQGLKYWYNKIQEDEILYARIKSFFNLYEDSAIQKLEPKQRKKAKDELEDLKNVEIHKQTSLVFDDCNANLSEIENASENYAKLSSIFNPVLLKENKDSKKISLVEIHELFTNLVASLPS